jgi:hypothetical protein
MSSTITKDYTESRIMKDGIPGAPHGLTATHQDQVNAALLAFRE